MPDSISGPLLSQGVMALSPIIFGCIALVFWKILSMLRPSNFKHTYIRNTFTTVFTFIFLFYTSIVKDAINMLNCLNIDGVIYLNNDFSVVCWTSKHILIIAILVVPVFLIWIIGFPIVIF